MKEQGCATGKNSLIEFRDVVRTYGEGEALQYAVNHIDFTISKGEFVVILGQSGAGKVDGAEYVGRHGPAYERGGYH